MRRTFLGPVLLMWLASTFVPVTATADPIGPGKIIVAGDENWSAIDSVVALTFATNVAAFLAPGGGGQFLYHIEDTLPWLRGASWLAGLTAAGNTITNDGNQPDAFTEPLADYDAVFVARRYTAPTTVPTAALIAYVLGGGNVFVSLGSALNDDTGVNEATAWNPFLIAFGLNILPLYHDLVGDIPLVSSDPLLAGVPALYHNVGSIITLTGSDPNARLIAPYPGQQEGQGLFAIYEAPPPVTPPSPEPGQPVPEPVSLVLVGSGLGALLAQKRHRRT